MVEIVPHGTLDYSELAQLGLSADDLHVFSSNINPYGPPEMIIKAVAQAVTGPMLGRYPDRLSSELRGPLARYHGVEPEAIVVGNGTADLMWLIGYLFMQSRRTAILAPTFGEYANVAALMNVPCRQIALPGWEALPNDRFMPVTPALEDCLIALHAEAPEVVFLCNPNNPTGELFSPDEVRQMMATAPNALWIVDEAYMEFVAEPWSAADFMDETAFADKLIILRSMTKDFSLGGIRLGYLVASSQIAQRIQIAQPPWNVNILAQVAGEAAMRSLDWRTETLQQLRADTDALRTRFEGLGLEPRPTTTNYFLTPIDDPGELRTALLADGLLIRDCTSFGLPNFFRVATQLPGENNMLVSALQDYLVQRTAWRA